MDKESFNKQVTSINTNHWCPYYIKALTGKRLVFLLTTGKGYAQAVNTVWNTNGQQTNEKMFSLTSH